MTDTITESFCERCGAKYSFDTLTKPRGGLSRARVVSRGLKNFVSNDGMPMSEAMAAARDEVERAGTARQFDAFHSTFSFCMGCRQYTCPNCWNAKAGECLTCAPDLSREVLPAAFSNLPVAGPTGRGNGHAEHGALGATAWPEADLEREEPSGDTTLLPLDAKAEPAAPDVLARIDASVAAPPAAPPGAVADDLTADELAEVQGALAAVPEPAVASDTATPAVEPAWQAEAAVAGASVPESAETEISGQAVETSGDGPAAATAAQAATTGRTQTRRLLGRFRPSRGDTPPLPATTPSQPGSPRADVVPVAASEAPVPAPAAQPEPAAVPVAASEAPVPAPAAQPEPAAVPVAASEAPVPAPAAQPEPAAVPVAASEAPVPAPAAQPEPAAVPVAASEAPVPAPAAQPEPAAVPVAASEAPVPAPAAQPEPAAVPVAASEAPVPAPAAQPEPAAVPVAASEAPVPAPAAQPEPAAVPVAASEAPVPAPAAQPEPAAVPVAASEAPVPAPAAQPEPAAVPVAASEAPVPAPAPTDTIDQPTWQTVAPDATASPPPSWPAAPVWPATTVQGAADAAVPASPWASRLAISRPDPTGVWQASSEELLAAPARAAGAAPAVQACVSCGLSLSANARFCRRCGTRQA